MPLSHSILTEAVRRQFTAASDRNLRVRLIAGPGTGKSRCIEQRVDLLLAQGVAPESIYVISFTRASAADLSRRIVEFAAAEGRAEFAQSVHVSTMHSLALTMLRAGSFLGEFPATPVILDDWEQQNVFDTEFAETVNITLSRAREVRRAYDAHWQTLESLSLYGTPPITPHEQDAFTAFHPATKLSYACFLPGEVVRRCVDNMRMENLDSAHLLGIQHLIVDEYQDLNACDQEFAERIAAAGASLYIAGDDDQSLYAFRYAAPTGIQQFSERYPTSTTHYLQDCFRCTPTIVEAASTLIKVNPNRLPKRLVSVWSTAEPPVAGTFGVWRFTNGVEEARAIAESCRALIAAGLDARRILILIANTRAQMSPITAALQTAEVPYERPRGGGLLESEMGRLVYAMLQIVKDAQNYMAHRTLLGLQHRVGPRICANIARKAAIANLNYRELFYSPYPAGTFTMHEHAAVQKIVPIVQQVSRWQLSDTLELRGREIEDIIAVSLDVVRSQAGREAVEQWRDLMAGLPAAMNLEEVLSYLWTDTEAGQVQVLDAVYVRLQAEGPLQLAADRQATGRAVRILTMHGAKGLDGDIVFIPGLEQRILPSGHALQSPGLVQEARRLLYVSITRARAACFLSLAKVRTGQQAFALSGGPTMTSVPSSFLTDIGITPTVRSTGLTAPEVAAIMADGATM